VKFRSTDANYFDRRSAFALTNELPELWNLIDHWPLYVGEVNLARNLAITDLFRSTLSVPGDVVEFGCWKGSTTLLLAKLLSIYDPKGPKLVHVFDSFEGLTHFHEADSAAVAQLGNYQGSRQHLEACARLSDLYEMLVVHEGQIELTLPNFAKSNQHMKFSFVYCDTDLYSATSTILENMWQLLSIGGLMVFDQWNMEEFPGEGIAVNEFMAVVTGTFEMIKPLHTRQPTLALRRVL
jgi:SAM-dependent methyltransferase